MNARLSKTLAAGLSLAAAAACALRLSTADAPALDRATNVKVIEASDAKTARVKLTRFRGITDTRRW